MERYWVSLLIQDTENSKPWVCAMYDSYSSIEEAMKVIERGRENYRVLTAWVDTFDEDNKKHTVFHECYINALGNVEK